MGAFGAGRGVGAGAVGGAGAGAGPGCNRNASMEFLTGATGRGGAALEGTGAWVSTSAKATTISRKQRCSSKPDSGHRLCPHAHHPHPRLSLHAEATWELHQHPRRHQQPQHRPARNWPKRSHANPARRCPTHCKPHYIHVSLCASLMRTAHRALQTRPRRVSGLKQTRPQLTFPEDSAQQRRSTTLPASDYVECTA